MTTKSFIKMFVGIGIISMAITLGMTGQTVPVNTKRIEVLEAGRARNESRIDKLEDELNTRYAEIERQHLLLASEVADIKASTGYNRDILIGFSVALFSLLIATFLQGRSTHRMVNGAQAALTNDLNVAVEDAAKLRLELKECLGKEQCPLLSAQNAELKVTVDKKEKL
jgi:hypothetical protein